MLDNKGFDLWADNYDKSVGISDNDNTYPFAGYKKIFIGLLNEKSIIYIGDVAFEARRDLEK